MKMSDHVIELEEGRGPLKFFSLSDVDVVDYNACAECLVWYPQADLVSVSGNSLCKECKEAYDRAEVAVVCDGCNVWHWVDEMTESKGQNLCVECFRDENAQAIAELAASAVTAQSVDFVRKMIEACEGPGKYLAAYDAAIENEKKPVQEVSTLDIAREVLAGS